MSTTPRGIRNAKPGNIDRTTERCPGMAADQSSDTRFVVFTAPVWGLRALAKALLSYYRKRKMQTVESSILRWAPSVENNISAYATAVTRAMDASVADPLNVAHPDVLTELMKATAGVERV